MSEPMTFEEFCLDLVGTCQHCDGTGRAARPLSTEVRGCEVCNGRLCHEALEIPIARRLYDFLGPEHAHRALTGRMLVSYETIRLGMLADIERLGKTIAELQGRLTERNARIAELEQT